jgi:hypothetical protein
MTTPDDWLGPMRVHRVKAAGAACVSGLVLALALLPGGAQAFTCPAGNVCGFVSPAYGGAQGNSLCTRGVHPFDGNKSSGINNCANKAVWFRNSGVAQQCLNPGQLSPLFPGPVNEIWIGADGSRC